MGKKKSVIVNYNKLEREVWQLCEAAVTACGAELIDVEYVQEAGNWYLRFFIDREIPVDLDLCEQVSNAVSEVLDKDDPIDQAYFLEVSSPGVERPLKREQDFARFSGHEVIVKLYAPLNGKKEYNGTLKGLQEQVLSIFCDGNELEFDLSSVAKVHLRAQI